MTTLSLHSSAAPHARTWHSTDNAEIDTKLAALGLHFERWAPSHRLAADADAAAVLAAYAPEIERLKIERGYQSADVIRIAPDDPERATLRAKFIEEHIHDDDEVRFFVEGSGAFFVNLGDSIARLVCEAGDLLSVPAGTRHWFDMGPRPRFTAIRLFTSPAGWAAQFTGNPISAAIPRFDEQALQA